MAQDKNSFLLYCDIIATVDKLSDEQAGKLFKHLLNYVNDNDPILNDLLLEIAFEPIKQSLKRDLIKYENRRKTAQENGLKGGRPKNPAKPSKTQKTQSVISKPRKAVSVSVSVSDSVIKKEPSCPRNYSDDDYIMSEFIFDRVKAIYPNAKQPNLDKWANTIRLIREYDKLSHKQIQTVFIWANNNSFWQANIRSPEKLREKYEELDIKMQSENSNGTYQQALTPQQQLDSSISETQKYIDSLQ